MSKPFYGAEGVRKLLKLAQSEMETLRADLADIDRAKGASEAALDEIGETILREQQLSEATRPEEMGAFLDAMRERRANLQKTLVSLEDAGEAARRKLRASLAEIVKLEHLLDVNMRAAKARMRADEQSETDDAARARH